jgi:hypothetical protein
MQLQTEQTPEGIRCTHPSVDGVVATIVYSHSGPVSGWIVKHTMEHRLPHLAFDTLQAAEFYALAVACEIVDSSTN